MTDYSYLRWLQTQGPVQKDTSSKVAQRWSSVTPATTVGMQQVYITLPAFNLGQVFNAIGYSYILLQFNYQVSSPFTIVGQYNFPMFVGISPNGQQVICVRYRVGNTVFRYQLNPQLQQGNYLPYFNIPAPIYTGQIILPNFCLEVWCPSLVGIDFDIANSVPINLQTSLIQLPLELPVVSSLIAPISTVPFSDLSIGLPMTNPYTVPSNGPFISN